MPLGTVLAATSGAELAVAAGTCATVIVYIVVAVFAYIQVRDARKLRTAQARPYVFVDFDMSEPPMIHLAIQNLGKTAATDVRFECTPPLKSSLDPPGQSSRLAMLDTKWPSLPPGKTIRSFFDSGIHRLGPDPSLPLTYEVTAHYNGPSVGESYEEKHILDLTPYQGFHYIGHKDFDDLVKAVEKASDTFARWTTDDALTVLTKEYREHLEERERRITELRQATARQQTPLPDSTTPSVTERAVPLEPYQPPPEIKRNDSDPPVADSAGSDPADTAEGD